jgi:hypothetical protein
MGSPALCPCQTEELRPQYEKPRVGEIKLYFTNIKFDLNNFIKIFN